MKKLIILMSFLLMTLTLSACKAPSPGEAPGEETTVEDVSEVVEGECPDPAILGELALNHHIEQNYMGNNMTAETTGGATITIGTKDVNGNGSAKVQMTGSFPKGGCSMTGFNNVNIDVNGVCKDGQLELMLTETYSGGSITVTCPDHSGTTPIPPNTISHEISMPLKHNHTVTAPFVGEAGSGNYNWTLSLLPGVEDDDIEPVPLTDPGDDVEPVPLVPTPTS